MVQIVEIVLLGIAGRTGVRDSDCVCPAFEIANVLSVSWDIPPQSVYSLRLGHGQYNHNNCISWIVVWAFGEAEPCPALPFPTPLESFARVNRLISCHIRSLVKVHDFAS